MRNARYLVGLALVAAAASCGGSDKSSQGAKAPSDMTAEQRSTEQTYPSNAELNPPPAPSAMSNPSPESQLTAHELLSGTFACLLPQSGTPGTTSSTSMARPSMTPDSPPSSGRSYGTAPSPSSEDTAGARAFSITDTEGSGAAPRKSGSASSGSSSANAAPSNATPRASDTTGLGMTSGARGDSSCSRVAQASNVSPDALARGDSEATNAVRRLIQSRLSSEQSSADVSDNTLAFFDKGIAALNEAKIASQALATRRQTSSRSGMTTSGSPASTGKTTSGSGKTSSGTVTSSTGSTKSTAQSGSSSQPGGEDWSTQGSASTDQIRDHKALGELYQFGQNLGMTPMGSEAQSLAWIVGVSRFIAVRDVSANDKPLVAAPLFSALLNVPAPAPTAGRSMPTWNQYLAAAARSVNSTSSTGTRTSAVGGGPAPNADEKANLKEVARAAQDRMQVLAQHLPPSSELRDEVNESITELKTLTGSTSTSTPRSTK